jgi:Toxin SymE, type I toxin-antitoxin system
MRRRTSESTNNRPETSECICSGTSHCRHRRREKKLRRAPRINRRGFRVGTISSLTQASRQVPMLRLSGKWLARAGFEIGQPIEIDVQKGRLTIMVNTDPAETEAAEPVAI